MQKGGWGTAWLTVRRWTKPYDLRGHSRSCPPRAPPICSRTRARTPRVPTDTATSRCEAAGGTGTAMVRRPGWSSTPCHRERPLRRAWPRRRSQRPSPSTFATLSRPPLCPGRQTRCWRRWSSGHRSTQTDPPRGVANTPMSYPSTREGSSTPLTPTSPRPRPPMSVCGGWRPKWRR